MPGGERARLVHNGTDGAGLLQLALAMRFVHLFLAGYVVMILGVGLGLWQAGIFERIAPVWAGIGGLVAVGVGIMLAVASGKPTAIGPAAP